uniref:Uncharacterized protein n=1 Tax=Plectus sambesii TaxID=2011161 RepID=A0A914W6W3_9BILA
MSGNTTYNQDNRDNKGHMITGGSFTGATFNQQIHHDAPKTSNTYNNQNNQGRMVGGPIHGGTVNFGDTYNNSHNIQNTGNLNHVGGNMSVGGNFNQASGASRGNDSQ